MAVLELLLVLAFLSTRIQGTLASLYVINPSSTSVCHGGQPCTVDWLDDGELPLLTTIGACTVGLYTNDMQLIQQIEPVDVSAGHSLIFTPNPKAGPDSSAYYIAFTSTVFNNGSQPFQAFTPTFSIDQMKGSPNSAVASLTSQIPIPSSVSHPQSNPISTSFVSVASSAPRSGSASFVQSLSVPAPLSSPATQGSSTGFSKTSSSFVAQSTGTSSLTSSHLSSANSVPSLSRQSPLLYLALSSPFIVSALFS